MISRRRFATLLAAFVAVAAIGAATSPAKAALSIRIQMTDVTNGAPAYDSGVLPIGNGGNLSTGDQTVGTFTASVSSTPSEEAAFADLLSNTIEVANAGGANPSVLHILVTVSGYTLPFGTPLTVSSTASGGSTKGANGQAAVLHSYFDSMSNDVGAHIGALNGTAPSAKAYNFGNTTDLDKSFARPGGTYSLIQEFTITLAPGNRANLTLSTAVLPTVPEPNTLAMAGIGLAGLYFVRRRKARSQRLSA